MITRIEIDGFKSFENFALDLRPFVAIVGPNASGKSNLFDALRFLSLLAQQAIPAAMTGLRGEPGELFRRTSAGGARSMNFAVEILLGSGGTDPFGTHYETPTRRLRYELSLDLTTGPGGVAQAVSVGREACKPIRRKDDRASWLVSRAPRLTYEHSHVGDFIRPAQNNPRAVALRQDGPHKSGKPRVLPLDGASRTALSTVTTAEFPHLCALRDLLIAIRFLEIDPAAARVANDRLAQPVLLPDASNLAAVLSHLRQRTATPDRPDGVLADIGAALASLVPSVRGLILHDDPSQPRISFALKLDNDMEFSARVISDGTLRLLALLTILHDPAQRGVLCFEEPENGVHEGLIPALVERLREATTDGEIFQVLLATHSPAVMEALQDEELVVADSVIGLGPQAGVRAVRTRMRTGVGPQADLFDPEHMLTRDEVERLLRSPGRAA